MCNFDRFVNTIVAWYVVFYPIVTVLFYVLSRWVEWNLNFSLIVVLSLFLDLGLMLMIVSILYLFEEYN